MGKLLYDILLFPNHSFTIAYTFWLRASQPGAGVGGKRQGANVSRKNATSDDVREPNIRIAKWQDGESAIPLGSNATG